MKVKHLGELNPRTFFCRGCGIHQAADKGALCPGCEKLAAYIDEDIDHFPILVAAAALGIVIGGLLWLASVAG